MFRRFCLGLLMLMLAAPAMAAPLCHIAMNAPAAEQVSAADHAAMGHAPAETPAPDQPPLASGYHGCIGCVPPIATPSLMPAPTPRPLAAPSPRLLSPDGLAIRPALPPPRS